MGTVRVGLDEELASLLRRPDRSAEDGARDVIVTELYRRGTLSRGKAAALLGWSLKDFLRHAAALGIPYADYTEDEWAAEKRAVQEIAASLRPSATPAPLSPLPDRAARPSARPLLPRRRRVGVRSGVGTGARWSTSQEGERRMWLGSLLGVRRVRWLVGGAGSPWKPAHGPDLGSLYPALGFIEGQLPLPRFRAGERALDVVSEEQVIHEAV